MKCLNVSDLWGNKIWDLSKITKQQGLAKLESNKGHKTQTIPQRMGRLTFNKIKKSNLPKFIQTVS